MRLTYPGYAPPICSDCGAMFVLGKWTERWECDTPMCRYDRCIARAEELRKQLPVAA